MKTRLIGLVGLATVLGSGCTFVPQHPTIAPVTAAGAVIARQSPIALQVTDSRSDTGLGHTRFSWEAGIEAKNDPLAAIQAALTTALTSRGFTVTGSSPATFTVTLTKLGKVDMSMTAAMTKFDAAVKTTASDGNRTISREYTARDEYFDVLAHGEGVYGARLNKVLSEVLDKMLADQELMQFLAGSGTAVASQ